MKTTLFILAICCASLLTQAQDSNRAIISGSIKDCILHDPIANAKVYLINSETNQVIAICKSWSCGYFEIKHLPEGNYGIRIIAPGYSTTAIAAIPVYNADAEIYLGSLFLQDKAKEKDIEKSISIAAIDPAQ